ncbi:MAG: hypothetical protein IKO52_03525 [Clostridia bacterium]|nr:hypothetical protein [Clostridia bacterium]
MPDNYQLGLAMGKLICYNEKCPRKMNGNINNQQFFTTLIANQSTLNQDQSRARLFSSHRREKWREGDCGLRPVFFII